MTGKEVMGVPLILCPKCGAELIYDRSVGFPFGNVIYYEFDCTGCDFTGRILYGGYDDLWTKKDFMKQIQKLMV